MTFKVMSMKGHTLIDEAEATKAKFLEIMERGYVPFVEPAGEQVKEFDPSAEGYLFIAPVVGG